MHSLPGRSTSPAGTLGGVTRTVDMKRPASLGLGMALGLGAGWLYAALTRVPTVAAGPTPSAVAQRIDEAHPEASPETPSERPQPRRAPVSDPPAVVLATPPTAAPGPLPVSATAPRFAEASLRARFVEAFEEVETEGRIARVDCAELPCIVFGELPEADDLENLVSSDAFSPYGRDGLVQHQSEEAEDRYLFAVAVFEPPTDARERAQVEARLQARIRMGGSFRGR
jgi:hypothetical protein